jgi:hypothetical protein
MLVRNMATGKPIDVAPGKIAGNLQVNTLLGKSLPPGVNPNIPIGNDTNPLPMNALVGGPPDGRFGEWYDAPPDSITIDYNLIEGNNVFWHLPNNSMILLSRDEWRGDPPMWFGDKVKNPTVSLTRNTLAGFLAFGMISEAEADRILGNKPKAPPTVTETVVKASSTLLVIAVIGAAIWFLPRGFFKGAKA